MKPEIEVEIDGRKVRLALPLGGIDDIAKLNPNLGELAEDLRSSRLPWDQIKRIVAIGIKYGDKDVSIDDLYAWHGAVGMCIIAIELLGAAWSGVRPQEEDPGEA